MPEGCGDKRVVKALTRPVCNNSRSPSCLQRGFGLRSESSMGTTPLEATGARDKILSFLASPTCDLKPLYSKLITKVVVCLRLCPLCLKSLGSELSAFSAFSRLPSPVPKLHKKKTNSGHIWWLGLIPIVLVVVGFVTLFSWTEQQIFKMFLLRVTELLFCRKSARRNEQD